MSAMPWFRLYSRIIDDKKIKLLAFEDRWHFVALCCLKSSGEMEEPDRELRMRQVAVSLGVQLSELDEIGRRLRAVKLVDEDLQPVNWDKLQFKHETSTKRVREYRDRKKAEQKQGGNGMKRDETVSKRPPETETETEVIEAKASCASDDALKPAHVMDEWNRVAERLGKPRVRDLTPGRRQLITARIAQYTIGDFVTVFGKVEASPFLRGDGKWQGCTFDWVMKRANFQKIIEGNYDD
jgi:hypothetical protein